MVTDGFREHTPAELVEALTQTSVTVGGGQDSVEIEIQGPDGAVLLNGLMRLRVERGRDFDPVGSYEWVKIVVRMEPGGRLVQVGAFPDA